MTQRSQDCHQNFIILSFCGERVCVDIQKLALDQSVVLFMACIFGSFAVLTNDNQICKEITSIYFQVKAWGKKKKKRKIWLYLGCKIHSKLIWAIIFQFYT